MESIKKIIIGTASIRKESYFKSNSKLSKKVEALEYCLKKGCGIHISPTYGNSFSILSKINLKEYTFNKLISKIDFDKDSHPELQLELTSNLLKSKFFDVQILIDFSKYFSKNNTDWYDFEKKLLAFKGKYNINEFYLFPYYFDSDFVIELIKQSKIKFNFAVKYSLLDKEFRNSIIMQKNNGSKIMSIKGFGTKFGEKYSNLSKKSFYYQNTDANRKELEKISNKYKLNENQLRLLYTLKNPIIDYSCISFSNINQAKEAISIIKTDFKQEIFDSLELFNNNYSNSPSTHSPQPRHIKKRFVYNHSYKSIYISCCKLNLKFFGFKIILFSLIKEILKLNRDFIKYINNIFFSK